MRATGGLLDPFAARRHFTLTRRAPSPALAPYVDRYWIVRWDLAAPYTQETLPHPQINLVLGTHRPGLHGVCTTRFAADLTGRGWGLGTKFKSGAFRAFWPSPLRELTDRGLSVADAFGAEGAALVAAASAATSDEERIALVERFLLLRAGPVDDDALLAERAVSLATADASIARVADLAARIGVSVRKLERTFRSHVGVSPGWVIRRFRVQEAAERVAHGVAIDWPALASDLGYFDQAHFIREFKSQIGCTPGDYARRVRVTAAT
ncbi:MAG: AraC family transcriptional regulator [Labilithrix sp.]|nr:AraC family transcriptional regulator [Labilithrix sp.]MCW5818209.1 AraC family transcriptional regulator [Labilithrix sp.]